MKYYQARRMYYEMMRLLVRLGYFAYGVEPSAAQIAAAQAFVAKPETRRLLNGKGVAEAADEAQDKAPARADTAVAAAIAEDEAACAAAIEAHQAMLAAKATVNEAKAEAGRTAKKGTAAAAADAAGVAAAMAALAAAEDAAVAAKAVSKAANANRETAENKAIVALKALAMQQSQ